MQGVSESFELAWQNATYNRWYVVQWMTMLILGPALGLLLGWLRNWRRSHPDLLALVCLACFCLTMVSSISSVTTKWILRVDAAKFPEEKRIVDRDTANLAFIRIIGVFNGGIAVTLCLGMAWVGSRGSRRFRPQAG